MRIRIGQIRIVEHVDVIDAPPFGAGTVGNGATAEVVRVIVGEIEPKHGG